MRDKREAEEFQDMMFSAVPQDSRGNALRHALWIGLMTETAGGFPYFDEELGEVFGRVHEAGTGPGRGATEERIANSARSEEMDLHNNRVGANYGDGNASRTQLCINVTIRARSAHYLLRSNDWERYPNDLIFYRTGSRYKTGAGPHLCSEKF